MGVGNEGLRALGLRHRGRSDGEGRGKEEPPNGARQKQAYLPLSCFTPGAFPDDN